MNHDACPPIFVDLDPDMPLEDWTGLEVYSSLEEALASTEPWLLKYEPRFYDSQGRLILVRAIDGFVTYAGTSADPESEETLRKRLELDLNARGLVETGDSPLDLSQLAEIATTNINRDRPSRALLFIRSIFSRISARR